MSADVNAPFQRLSDWRARIGLLAILVLSLVGPVPDTVATVVFGERLFSAGVSFIVSGFVAAAFVGGYLWQHAGDVPAEARSTTTWVLVRAGTMTAYLLLLTILAFAIPESAQNDDPGGVFFVLFLPILWVMIFTYSMVWYALRWVYGISDVNPMLGPAASAATAVAAATVDQIINLDDPRPAGTQQALEFFAVASVLLLAGCEAYFLHRGGQAVFDRWVSPPRHGNPGAPGYLSGQPTRGARLWNWLAGPPDGLAATAFVVAWCLPVVGFIVALIAVLRVGRNPYQGAWLPVCALIVSVAWPIVYLTAIR